MKNTNTVGNPMNKNAADEAEKDSKEKTAIEAVRDDMLLRKDTFFNSKVKDFGYKKEEGEKLKKATNQYYSLVEKKAERGLSEMDSNSGDYKDAQNELKKLKKQRGLELKEIEKSINKSSKENVKSDFKEQKDEQKQGLKSVKSASRRVKYNPLASKEEKKDAREEYRNKKIERVDLKEAGRSAKMQVHDKIVTAAEGKLAIANAKLESLEVPKGQSKERFLAEERKRAARDKVQGEAFKKDAARLDQINKSLLNPSLKGVARSKLQGEAKGLNTRIAEVLEKSNNKSSKPRTPEEIEEIKVAFKYLNVAQKEFANAEAKRLKEFEKGKKKITKSYGKITKKQDKEIGKLNQKKEKQDKKVGKVDDDLNKAVDKLESMRIAKGIRGYFLKKKIDKLTNKLMRAETKQADIDLNLEVKAVTRKGISEKLESLDGTKESNRSALSKMASENPELAKKMLKDNNMPKELRKELAKEMQTSGVEKAVDAGIRATKIAGALGRKASTTVRSTTTAVSNGFKKAFGKGRE